MESKEQWSGNGQWGTSWDFSRWEWILFSRYLQGKKLIKDHTSPNNSSWQGKKVSKFSAECGWLSAKNRKPPSWIFQVGITFIYQCSQGMQPTMTNNPLTNFLCHERKGLTFLTLYSGTLLLSITFQSSSIIGSKQQKWTGARHKVLAADDASFLYQNLDKVL